MFRVVSACAIALCISTAAADEKKLADALKTVDTNFFKPGSDEAKAAATTLSRDAKARLLDANRRSTEEWKQIKTKADWEKFRDAKLKALAEGILLGGDLGKPITVKPRVTGTIDGDGYRIEKIVFTSRDGMLITANLYTPPKPATAMPGILIVHSHHNPKTQGELQDMGITWAKEGCVVLIPDMLGHGERRSHPFKDEASYTKEKFAPGRQDYYFRYNTGIQLHLIGDSLLGWMVLDLMSCVDVLLSHPGIDPKRIAVFGSVAAGGDSCAVVGALDRRIAVVAPFNFGGPQPETVYPLPPNAETAVNWAGSGSWESTRNLTRSAADGFLPWVIVGSVAPRGLIYGHEFAWDAERDPVWKRLETIWGFYDSRDRLSSTHGRGAVTGKPPEATHCNNIGPVQRKGMYPALKAWLDLPIPDKDVWTRHDGKDLWCLTAETAKEMKPLTVIAGERADERIRQARKQLEDLPLAARRERLRASWSKVLGNVAPKGDPKADLHAAQEGLNAGCDFITLEVEPGIVVPLVLLTPPKLTGKAPVVVGLCQQGKAVFLKNQAAEIAALLESGIAVCLPDVRGTGETRAGDGRGRRTSATGISATDLMLGQPLVAAQLRDLRSVLRFLRTDKQIDADRVALWGTSFAKTNPTDRDLGMPLEIEPLPDHAEPLGGLLALLGGLYEDSVKAVIVQNGLTGYRTVLDSQFVYVPHDAIVPGALTAGDLCDVAAALAPRPLRIEGSVDGLNRRVPDAVLKKVYEPTTTSYAGASASESLGLRAEPGGDVAAWLVNAFGTK
jgi:dienelactone hydrolase